MEEELKVKGEINSEIPSRSKIKGIYDDEEERWIKFPIQEMEMNAVSGFIRETVKEISRVSNTFNIEKVDFDLLIDGQRIKLTATVKSVVENR